MTALWSVFEYDASILWCGSGKPFRGAHAGRIDLEGDVAETKLSERLRIHVDRLAGLIGPRHVLRPDALVAAETYVRRELEALGDAVERHTYLATSDQEVANLVVERPGTSRAQEIVILGAHYDSVPGTPGADDNASAVAVLIESARLLRGLKTRRTLRFVAFTCEEPPHFHTNSMGSQAYAARCRRRGDQIAGMICLEMVGYYSDAPGSQRLPPELPRFLRWAFPRRGNFLAAVGNIRSARICWEFRRGFKSAVDFPLYSIFLPENVHSIRLSDNSSFWDQGYPALMVTDTSFLRNPHYHQSTDTVETLDYDRMASVTRGVVGAMARLARAFRSGN